MNYKSLDRAAVMEISKRLAKALATELATISPELRVSLGRVTFVPGSNMRCKLTVETAAPKISKPLMDIPGLGDKWIKRGHTYTYTHFKPRNHKYPYLMRRGDGKLFKVDLDWFRTADLIR